MKIRLTSIVSLCVSIVVFQNCSDEPQPETDRVKALLVSSVWNMNSVVVDGVDNTQVYSGLNLTFTENSIDVENGREVWPENMDWTFADNSAQRIERADGLLLTVEEISETTLVLRLHWNQTTFRGGRNASVAGNHTFSFTH